MQPLTQNLDITKTTPIFNKEGGLVWQQGFLLRKASRFLTATDEDQIIPIPIFYNPETGEINEEGMPENMKFLFNKEI